MGPGPRSALLRVVIATGLATLLATSAAGAPLLPTLGAGSQVDPDSVLLETAIRPDGDARWEIRYRVRLDDENATAAFESLEADVRTNASGFEDRFAERMARTVGVAENATGREMAVRNVSVATNRQDLGQRYGELIYRFEWTNFAVANGTTIVAGDAVGGLFLDGETTYTVRWPEGYGLARVDPPPAETGERSVTWRGPAEFSAEQPRVVVSTTAPTGTATNADGPNAGGDGLPLGIIAGALALLLVVVGGAAVWVRRGGASASPAAGDQPPEELLSNEERVLRLLRENGGRMKQQQVVEELGWTDAKTSQVVGNLRESGEVEGFRLGRENVLRLPGEEEG